MDTVWFAVEMLLLGCAVGTISAALGLGGGIFMVPAFLFFVRGIDAHTAKGTSLFIIIFVASLNTWRLNRGRRNAEDSQYGLAAIIGSGSVIGGYLGSRVTAQLQDSVVIWVFIALLAYVGLRTFFIKPVVVRKEDVRRRTGVAVGFGVLAGVVGGATGTGGGAVLVPLTLMAGLVTNERAVALSNMVMVVTSISGTVAHLLAAKSVDLPWTYGHINFALAPLVFIGAQIAAPFAVKLEKWLTLPRRKVAMGALLLAMTGGLVWKTLAS